MQNAETTLAIIREQSMTLITGEPCAAKVACTVRGEAHGKGPQGTSPGAYPTVARVGVVGPTRARDSSAAPDPHIVERGNGPSISIGVSCLGGASRPGTTLGYVL